MEALIKAATWLMYVFAAYLGISLVVVVAFFVIVLIATGRETGGRVDSSQADAASPGCRATQQTG